MIRVCFGRAQLLASTPVWILIGSPTLASPLAHALQPPWYQTLWAYALLAVLGAALAFVLARSQTRQMERIRAELEVRVGQRTEELAALNRNLELSEAQLKEAQQISHLGSWEWDARTGDVVWSDELFRIWGLDPQQFTPSSENYFSMLEPQDRERITGVVLQAIETNRPFDFYHRFHRPDGSIGWIHGRGRPHVGADGQPVRLAGTAQDVTERKRLEDELVQSTRAADAANRAKSNFLSTISHELRTPLAGILGITDLLLDTELTPYQREYVELMRSSGGSLLEIVRDLLDLSRIEAGKLELETTNFKLRPLLDQALKPLALEAERKGLVLTSRVADDVPERVLGDSSRLRQIILNLVANAIKFTEQGEIDVSVRTASPDEEETPPQRSGSRSEEAISLLFTVRDTGVGVPPEKQKLIFAPLVQADSSLRRRHEGSGLGLAISDRLVRLMNGRIWCESTPGQGSTFRFVARFGVARTGERFDSPLRPLDSIASAWPAGAPRGLRILLAEDNLVFQRVIEDFLSLWGHRVVVCDNGKQAVKAYQEQRFDLAILDVRMPEMDGLEAAACIREWESRSDRHLPILALTAQAMKGDQERSLDAGCDSYLTKPVTPQELAHAIVRLASAESTGGESAARARVDLASGSLESARQRLLRHGAGHGREFVRLFRQRIPEWQAAVENAVANGDAQGLRENAHSLRGAMIQFDATAVSEIAERLETMGRDADLEGAEDALRSLREKLDAFQTMLLSLDSELESGTGGA